MNNPVLPRKPFEFAQNEIRIARFVRFTWQIRSVEIDGQSFHSAEFVFFARGFDDDF